MTGKMLASPNIQRGRKQSYVLWISAVSWDLGIGQTSAVQALKRVDAILCQPGHGYTEWRAAGKVVS